MAQRIYCFNQLVASDQVKVNLNLISKSGLTVLFFTILLLVLSGCALEEDETVDWSAEKFYNEAKSDLDSGNYFEAIKLYETLESRYPFGKYATQAQLDVAYAYHLFDEPESALASADRFIRLHPRHNGVDYAYYLKGLINFKRGGTVLDSIQTRDLSEYDQSHLVASFDDFSLLLKLFPNSKYANDARDRMVFLRNKMAEAELKAAEYYFSRDAWVAAANRTRNILQTYQGSDSIKRALQIQYLSYTKLNLDKFAEDTRRVLIHNFGEKSAENLSASES